MTDHPIEISNTVYVSQIPLPGSCFIRTIRTIRNVVTDQLVYFLAIRVTNPKVHHLTNNNNNLWTQQICFIY